METKYSHHLGLCSFACFHKEVPSNVIIYEVQDIVLGWYLFWKGKFYGDFINLETKPKTHYKIYERMEFIDLLIEQAEESYDILKKGNFERRGNIMLNTILKSIVLAIVLYIVYYLVQLIVAAFALPAVVALIVGVLLAIGFLIWVLKEFGIGF